MISRIFPSKLQQIHLISVSGHCTHFMFKICQTVASTRINCQFNESCGSYLLACFLLFGPTVLRTRPNPAKTGRRRALDRVDQRARAGGDMAGMLLFETCKDAASWHASMIMMMITNDFPRFHAIIMINMNGKLGPSSF